MPAVGVAPQRVPDAPMRPALDLQVAGRADVGMAVVTHLVRVGNKIREQKTTHYEIDRQTLALPPHGPGRTRTCVERIMSAGFAGILALECDPQIGLDRVVGPSICRFGNTWGTRRSGRAERRHGDQTRPSATRSRILERIAHPYGHRGPGMTTSNVAVAVREPSVGARSSHSGTEGRSGPRYPNSYNAMADALVS
jgi:hypothetical protein